MVGSTAVASRTEQVVQREACPHEGAVHERPAVDREQEALQAYQVRRQPQQPRTLRQCLAHQLQAQVFEVAQPTVDKTRGPRRGADREVVLLDEHRLETT